MLCKSRHKGLHGNWWHGDLCTRLAAASSWKVWGMQMKLHTNAVAIITICAITGVDPDVTV